jgi:CubicO group peptidase (beta-lactamase class C family)
VAGTYFWIDPHEHLIAIFLIQAPEQRSHYPQLFRNRVYAAIRQARLSRERQLESRKSICSSHHE